MVMCTSECWKEGISKYSCIVQCIILYNVFNCIYFQLLARLCRKPSLALLEPELFPSGIEPRTVIELYGEEGSGKTQYLVHLIANAILPPSLNGAIIGGLGVSIILIDNDYSFNLLRLISILEVRISSASASPIKNSESSQENLTGPVPANAESTASVDHCSPKKPRLSKKNDLCAPPMLRQSTENSTQKFQTSQTHNRELVNEMDIECCVKECLKRLYIVHCNSSAQLFITLHTLETVLANRSEMCLLAIDSISSFFWLDKFNGTENNLSLIAEIIQKLADTYSLVVFATKSSAVYQRPHKKDATDNANHKDEHKEYLCKAWQKLVSSRIIFSKDTSGEIDLGNSQAFCASVCGKERILFTIDESGLRFLSS